jgi:hypothetical protein
MATLFGIFFQIDKKVLVATFINCKLENKPKYTHHKTQFTYITLVEIMGHWLLASRPLISRTTPALGHLGNTKKPMLEMTLRLGQYAKKYLDPKPRYHK